MMPLATLVLLFLQGTAAAAPSDDVARLVPADAAIVVRLESARALDALLESMRPLLGDAAGDFDLQSELDDMAAEDVAPEERPVLDDARPVYLTVAFDPAAGPSVRLLAPVANGKAFRFRPERGSQGSVVLGGYAAVSDGPGLAPGEPQTALLAKLRPGLVSVHVDLARIVATFRPLIDMALDQAEGSLEQVPDDVIDMEPLLELYLDGAREFVENVLSLDVVLAHAGDELSAQLWFEERRDRWPALPLSDPGALLGLVDLDSPIQLASNVDPTQLFGEMQDLVEAALAMYPEPLRSDLERAVDLWHELEPLLAPGLAAGVSFGPDGLRGTYALRASDGAAVAAKLEEGLRSLHREDGFFRVGAAETLLAGGIPARVLPLSLHYDALLAAIERAAPRGTVDPAEEQRLADAFGALYGAGGRVALAHRGETVLVSFAPDESGLRTDLARLEAPHATAPEMLRLLARIEPGASGLVYRFDLGRTMGQMAAVLRDLVPDPPELPPFGLPIDAWGSMLGGSTSFGVALRLGELAEFVRAARSVEER